MKRKYVGLVLIILMLIVLFTIKWITQDDAAQSDESVTENVAEITKEELVSTESLNNYLKMLVSESFDGRFPGTPGNIAAAEFIRKTMIDVGLSSPEFTDDFFMTFSAIIPIKIEKTTLALETEQEMFHFDFGRDYVEFVTRNFAKGIGAYSGSFRIIDDPLDLYSFEDSDIIVYTLDAIKDINYDTLFNQILLEKNKPKMVLYESNQQNSGYFVLSPYSRFVTKNDNEDGMMIYKVSQKVIEKLMDHSEGVLHASTHVETNRIDMSNIIGMIDGTGDSGYVLMAHFDHLGNNFDGTYNPGAIDNASGVATLLALSETLFEHGNPDLDYYFIAFNGEEAGLYGSEAFAAHMALPIEGFEFINIDMVGSSANIPVTVSSTMIHSHALQSRMLELANELGIETIISDSGSSDHVPIEYAGYSAVSLTELDKRYYHSPNDTIENSIDFQRMHQIALLIYNLVIQ